MRTEKSHYPRLSLQRGCQCVAGRQTLLFGYITHEIFRQSGRAYPDTSSGFHEREAPAAFRVLLRGTFPPADNRRRFSYRPDRVRQGTTKRYATKGYVRHSLRPGLYRGARRFANRRYSDYRHEFYAHKT